MKRGNIKKKYLFLFSVLLIFLVLIETSSALRVSPAVKKYNFVPGLEKTITYTTSGGGDKELELYVKGDLAEYVTLNKNELVGGGGTFTATLKLPEELEKPGKNVILVGVKEKVDEELVDATIGTSIIIQVVIVINVPYPGRYLEVNLKSHNVNVGEPVNFDLEINSKGKEDVNITPKIDITSEGKTIETLYFKNRVIQSQEYAKLRKTLDTIDYNPGKYTAVAVVDYGIVARAESEFRIGELVVNMVNYTRQIIIKGIKKFEIEVESGWNNNIDGVYAEVFILNDSETLIDFKTSSTDLKPWEKKAITGFFDTKNFTAGFYDANITLVYYGKDRGKSSSELVEIEFIEEVSKTLIIAIIVGIILLLIGILLIKKYLLKNGKKKK